MPLAATFKPAMKVLSRKPAPKMIAKKDPITGIERMTLQDDDDDDDESKKNQPTPEEIKLQQQRDREEKQRRYDEARAKIFVEPSPASPAHPPSAHMRLASDWPVGREPFDTLLYVTAAPWTMAGRTIIVVRSSPILLFALPCLSRDDLL